MKAADLRPLTPILTPTDPNRGRLSATRLDEEAQRLWFPGSPTIRVEGEDLFPAPEREDWRLGCRVYETPEGLRGSPTAEMLREALKTKGAAGADRDL